MTALQRLLESTRHDPIFAYTLLAAALLVAVSLASGLVRRDVAVLARPRLLLRVLGAVLAGFVLAMVAGVLTQTFGASPWARLAAGLQRFPLALVALAYGPVVGMVVGALAAGLQTTGPLPGWHQAVFTLELGVLGWLAIYPSPRTSRWAGPFNALLAHLLAWGTAGLALLEARTGSVTVASLWAQQRPLALGVAATVVALALVPPEAYRRAFPHSRIAPYGGPLQPAATAATAAAVGPRGRDPLKLTCPELPGIPSRARRHRELDPLPGFLSDDSGDPG